MLDICTSLTGCRPCDYCRKCSHSLTFGEGRDTGGRLWKWEFNPWFGPLFLRADGEPLKRQPIAENHPAWAPFEAWQKRHEKPEEED